MFVSFHFPLCYSRVFTFIIYVLLRNYFMVLVGVNCTAAQLHSTFSFKSNYRIEGGCFPHRNLLVCSSVRLCTNYLSFMVRRMHSCTAAQYFFFLSNYRIEGGTLSPLRQMSSVQVFTCARRNIYYITENLNVCSKKPKCSVFAQRQNLST